MKTQEINGVTFTEDEMTKIRDAIPVPKSKSDWIRNATLLVAECCEHAKEIKPLFVGWGSTRYTSKVEKDEYGNSTIILTLPTCIKHKDKKRIEVAISKALDVASYCVAEVESMSQKSIESESKKIQACYDKIHITKFPA